MEAHTENECRQKGEELSYLRIEKRQDFNHMKSSRKNINREDMLELTRRMTPSRTSFTRIAGCYVDKDGDFEGSFNVNFLKLSQKDKAKNLEIAKTIPFSETNVQLKRYKIEETSREVRGLIQMLNAMKECGLKNDALMDTFYDIIMENYESRAPYGIMVFHDRYDVPVKTSDKERQWESEEVYEYLICALCPLADEYEPDKPFWGFLFPAFTDRSCDWDHINIFHAGGRNYEKLDSLLGVKEKE